MACKTAAVVQMSPVIAAKGLVKVWVQHTVPAKFLPNAALEQQGPTRQLHKAT